MTNEHLIVIKLKALMAAGCISLGQVNTTTRDNMQSFGIYTEPLSPAQSLRAQAKEKLAEAEKMELCDRLKGELLELLGEPKP